MAIEFYCQDCGKQVRTPDDSAGKQGKCPQCGALMVIPTTTRAGATKPSVGASSGVGGSASANASGGKLAASKWKEDLPAAASDAPIEFDCPSCGQVVRTPAASAGKKGRCPHCREVMQIPAAKNVASAAAATQPAARQAVASQSAAQQSAPKKAAIQKPIASPADAARSERLEFYCSSCAGIVRTAASAAGKKGKCPQCSAIVDIPLTSDPAIASRSGSLMLLPTSSTGLTPLPDSAMGLTLLPNSSAGLTLLPDNSTGLTPLPATNDLFLDSSGLGAPGMGVHGAPAGPFTGSFGSPGPLGMDGFGPNTAWQAPAVSTNPYAAPSYSPTPNYGQPHSDGSGARTATRVCGILMAVVGGFYTFFALIAAVLALTGSALLGFASRNSNLRSTDQATLAGMMVGMVVGFVIGIAWYVTILIGGIQMARLRQWGLAMTASVFCIVTLLFTIFSLNPCAMAMNFPTAALGVWGIIMLCNSAVKHGFR